jgi:hypothetical protein
MDTFFFIYLIILYPINVNIYKVQYIYLHVKY